MTTSDGGDAAGDRPVRPVLICFAGDIWTGNPHSRHHLCRRFARRFDVLFVEGVPMRGIVLGDTYEWRRLAAKMRVRPGVSTPVAGLHVLRPLSVPPLGVLGRRLQLAALRRAVEHACHTLRLRGPRIAWFSLPVAAPLLGQLRESLDVFYYQDRYSAFTHVDAARLDSHTRMLAGRCDLVMATSDPLADDLRALGANPVVLPHGVDVDQFATATAVPADVAGLERPLIGCVGLVDDHLDLPAIRAIADRLERGTVVLIGAANIDVGPLQHRRIALLGPRPYTDMPAYIGAFDLCLIPFAVNALTTAVNPIKLREYLAAGKPVVATALPAIEPFRDVVTLVESGAEFATAVIDTLRSAANDGSQRERRRELAAAESWDAIAERIERLMLGALPAGTLP